MKNVRFFFAAIVFLFFTVGVSNAQNKTVETDFWDFVGVMDCTDDNVVGVETMVVTNWQSKYQVRYKGEYEGSSGKHYSWSLVVNDNWKSMVPGQGANRTIVSTSVVECEGVPIAMYKIRFHASMNANGEITVYRDWDSGDEWICL